MSEGIRTLCHAILADPAKPTVPQVAPIVRAFYAKGKPAGGWLHVVLDDGNVADASVEACIETARGEGDWAAEALGLVLLRCSVTQRRKLARLPR